MATDEKTHKREKGRERRKRHYQRHIGEPKKLHVVPVYLPPDLERLLDELSQKYDQGGGRSGFMRRAFEHYAAHLMETSSAVAPETPVTEAAPEEALQIVTQGEPASLQIVTLTEADPLQIVTPSPEPSEVDMIRDVARQAPARKPRNMYQQRWIDRAEADAANRVPVRLEFTRLHHHIPHGMRSMMMNNGLKHRKNIWRGRLTPERAAAMAHEIAAYGGTLEITGKLGDDPKWTKEEWGGGKRRAEVKAA